MAVEESDLLLFVVDGKQGLVSADEEVWSHFRRFNKPAVLVVNKGDTKEAQNRFSEFYRLGIDRQLLISAEHGGGIGDLREALALALPEIPDIPAPETRRRSPSWGGRTSASRRCSTRSPGSTGRSSRRSRAPPAIRSTP